MGTHRVAEAKNRLSELIDRALAGEGVTITRHGKAVVELRPVEAGPGPVRQEGLDWLRARAAGRGPVPAMDAGRLVSLDARRRRASRLYLDASVLVPLLAADAFTARLLLGGVVLARAARERFRCGGIRFRPCAPGADGGVGGRQGVGSLRRLRRMDGAGRVETTAADVRVAEAFVRRLDLTLRAPDALNIAIAQRTGAALATFDEKMAAAAQALSVEVAGA